MDGWIEFLDKKVAKTVAKTLNAQPVGGAVRWQNHTLSLDCRALIGIIALCCAGGKNRSFYAHDLWNLKYLSKFKWNHLTEKICANVARCAVCREPVTPANRPPLSV